MEFPIGTGPLIIAMKGLPFTFKSEMASLIGAWARCPVLYIDDFLNAVSLERGYSSTSMPSEEEAERLHRLAFDALCKSAHRRLQFKGCVVIKSRLCSTFELDHLLQLSRERRSKGLVTIIIIECRVKNEHRWCARLESKAKYKGEREREWYKPWSKLGLEKARDDWLSSQANWYLHLSNLIDDDNKRYPARVIRLALDPFDDFDLNSFGRFNFTSSFRDAIGYLLTRQHGAQEEDWIGEEIIIDRYEVVQFDKLRRYLVERELLRASTSGQKKSIYLCPTTRGGKCCVFKTCCIEQELRHHYYNCWVCGERVVSTGYICHFCILALHKSCAEHQGFNFKDFTSNFWLQFYPRSSKNYLPRRYACNSCAEGGKKGFSEGCKSCLYQTHLKCRVFPTIINHDSHHHSLSFQLGDPPSTICKACGHGVRTGRYGCYVCGLYYCLTCVLRPGEVEHHHGGHQHVMKLVYSHDGMEPEEDYWCGVCYEDMDPQHWFYSCQDCPYYQVHAWCLEKLNRVRRN